MGGKTGKIGLAAALTIAAMTGAKKKPEKGVQTDKEGIKKYLLKQSELEKHNKPSKRKLKKARGKKKRRRK